MLCIYFLFLNFQNQQLFLAPAVRLADGRPSRWNARSIFQLVFDVFFDVFRRVARMAVIAMAGTDKKKLRTYASLALVTYRDNIPFCSDLYLR